MNGLNAKAIYGDINSELGEYIFRLHKVVNCETRSKYTDKKKRQKKERAAEHTEIARRMIRGNNATAF